MKNWILFILSFNVIAGYSQGGHYWTQQYGTRSMLLSGSVIGGVEDLGAVYYNPARLSQVENPAFLISADVYEYNTLSIKDAFGKNENASKAEFGGVPSLAAGSFKLGFMKKHQFAWAILLRQDLNLGFSYKNDIYGDVLENFPGEEYFGAELELINKGKEEWTGLSWSYPINEKWSIGMSGFLTIVNYQKGNLINMQALAESGQVTMFRFSRSYTFNQTGILWKAGISYKSDHLLAGLTLKTPSVKIMGGGKYKFENFFSGTDSISGYEDTYTSSSQKDLGTTYHSPWALGFGTTWLIGKNKLHISAEWYSNVPSYTLMNAKDHYSQSTGDTIRFVLKDQLNGVMNVGLGIEFYISEKISGYASTCTDFSAVTSDINHFIQNKPEVNNSILKSDFYHFGAGIVLDLKGADLTLGVTYTGAKQKIIRPLDFPEGDSDPIVGSDEKATMQWNRWRIVFSFSFPFLKDVEKKVEERLGI